MGRKSSAKSSSQPPSSSEPPSHGGRSSTPLLAAGLVAIVAIVGVLAYTRSGREASAIEPAAHAAPAADAARAVAAQPLKAHKQANLPPLPFQAYAPPRPPDVVRAAYVFAAEHPEILSYVPCFCGCERAGHKGNEDCFVARRNDAGDVVEWDPHGLDCAVCLDVARDAQQMYSSGASVRDIRSAIEKKWASAAAHGTHTPTPMPPKP
jgi:TPR repeat protein